MTNAEIEKIIDQSVEKAEKRFEKSLTQSEKRSDTRMQKYITKLTKESKEQIEQYVGAISEESKYNIEAVGEQYSGLNEKVDSVIDTGNKIDQKVENTIITLVEVKNTLDATFEAVGNHEERITVLEQKVR